MKLIKLNFNEFGTTCYIAWLTNGLLFRNQFSEAEAVLFTGILVSAIYNQRIIVYKAMLSLIYADKLETRGSLKI